MSQEFMADRPVEIDRTHAYLNPVPLGKRVSWGAIFAGAVIALALQIALNILGLGIGVSAINPATEANPMSGFGTGAAFWFSIATLLSLFAGGWVSGRLAGIPRTVDSSLHGLLTWGLATLLLFYLLTSTVGTLIGGTFRALGNGLSAASRGVAAAAPEVAGVVKEQLVQSGVELDLSSIKEEINTTLKQTRKADLQPGTLEKRADNAGKVVKGAASEAASDPAESDRTVEETLERLRKSGSKTMDAADKDALINVVMARTGKSRPEAEATVASYEKSYQELYAKYEETKAQAEAKARELAQATAEATTSAALWAFAALLASAVAAAAGGFLATPHDVAVHPRRVA